MRFIKYIFLAISILGCRALDYPENELGLYIRRDMLFIALEINDKKGLFLLDTGAGLSLIDSTQARSYGYSVGRKDNFVEIMGLGGAKSVYAINDIKVGYQEFDYKRFRFYGSDISGINDVLSRNHIKILGILGSDFLSTHNATIDYGQKILMLNGRE